MGVQGGGALQATYLTQSVFQVVLQHRSVNLSLTTSIMKKKLTDLCGN